ncbi:MAG TPA: GMC family oxidoreductase [Myxococcota bacterium]|jgi:choline dehydrogenase-like flavoprotein
MTTFDAVVVGSGAGGAPLACALCEAGYRVLLIERGREVKRADFDRDEIEWCRRDGFVPSPHNDPHMWRSDVNTPAYKTADGWISTLLGGGTMHMAAYLLRADEADARQGTRLAHEAGSQALDWAVPFADVARYYDEIERALGVSQALKTHALAHKLDRAATALGIPTMPTPRGILTSPQDGRLACDYREQCASYGCPTGARASMPTTYIPRAQRTGNLTLWTHAMCRKVERGAVHVLHHGVNEVVPAKIIVVACGAVESARLLLLSGMGGARHPSVGKHLWFSLCAELSGFFAAEAHGDVDELMAGSPFLNRSVHHGAHLDDQARARTGLDRSGMFEASFVHENPIHRAERVAFESEPGNILVGTALKRALAKAFHGGRTVILEGFAESVPHAGAFVDLDPHVVDPHGLPVARITHAHHARNLRVCDAQIDEGKALLAEMGAVDIRVTRAPSMTLALQGGTCRFGTDPSTSATDPEGRIHGEPDLYVADGASMPSSLACPTTLTLIANSLRIAAGIIKRG